MYSLLFEDATAYTSPSVTYRSLQTTSSASSSAIVSIPDEVAIVAPTGLDKLIRKISGPSARRSPLMVTSMGLSVSPGRNVRVPLVAT